MNAQDIKRSLEKQRKFFDSGNTKEISFRIESLKNLKDAIIKYSSDIYQALQKDLGKNSFEAYETEVGFTIEELNYVIGNLKKWIRPKRVGTPMTLFSGSSFLYPEPYGLTLIIAPWNYPFQLLMSPLIGAIAAGNCCIVKPSEIALNTSKIIKKIISKSFKQEYVLAVEGDRKVSERLLKERYDYIFYTGGTEVGKIIMSAASKNLTPVTLELGGKSPCIIDKSANLITAAKRVAWGKFLNAGQTCVAPDYLLIHDSVYDEYIQITKSILKDFYGEKPELSKDYGRIINDRHFKRIINLLKKGTILIGGETDSSTRYIAPTLIGDIKLDDPIMKEEIFGPLLPVITYSKLSECISIIKSHEKPLAFYLFTEDREMEQEIISQVPFGGGCINDTILHLANPELPFGGVGLSGMGSYHGKYSFETFSHIKSIYKRNRIPEIPLRFPPSTPKKLRMLKFFLGE